MRVDSIAAGEEKTISHHAQPATTKDPAHRTRRESALVRRVVRGRDDPVKQRVLAWLADIDDERLLAFGLTPEDIKILRETKASRGDGR